MKTTANYALQIPEASDTVNLLTQNYPNFETIDTAMKANKDAAITTATETKTGTNHAILRSNDGSNMFRFVATSNMVAGDTFTVDSIVVTATTPDGKTLANGAFVINQNVLCCLVGTLLTVYAGGSAEIPSSLTEQVEFNKKSIESINESLSTIISGTLSAGSTEITLSDARITPNSIIETWINVGSSTTSLIGPTAMAVSTGKCVLTYDAQDADIVVGIRVI